jgi:hypothetical protein
MIAATTSLGGSWRRSGTSCSSRRRSAWRRASRASARRTEKEVVGVCICMVDTEHLMLTMCVSGEEAVEGGGEAEDDDEYAINLSDEDDGVGGAVDTDGLPFACFICRERFTDPVVTMCKHYFCGQCARDYSRKNKTNNCAACGKNTSGVFNKADKLARKIAKLKGA